MTPFQQLYLGLGASKKTYVDDVFSNYLYTGTGSARSIDNGINLSGEGGLTWFKRRDISWSNRLVDTERGVTKGLNTDTTNYEVAESAGLTAFNTNGFSIGTDSDYNGSSDPYSSCSFRRAKGFFDLVKYDGNGTNNRQVSHNLGCKPGLILIKRYTDTEDWEVYHRSKGATYDLRLNTGAAGYTSAARWNNTEPTATHFTLGTDGAVNGSGESFVAYLFAGGESEAATARSINFNGSNDGLTIPTHADLAFGTGDFTLECWLNIHAQAQPQMIYDARDNIGTNRIAIWIRHSSDTTIKVRVQGNNVQKDSNNIPKNEWLHFAWSRQGSTSRMFINGILQNEGEWSDSVDYAAPSSNAYIGRNGNQNTAPFNGDISNFRIVKGTAVYTSSFRVPTEPLTNITNTKLLCCNQSTPTGSTVSPTTIADPNTSTAKTDSPFDDPAGFVFGPEKDQNIIKCGSYIGNGVSGDGNGPEINLGWEPQWVMVKNTTASGNWLLLDNMRGWFNQEGVGTDKYLYANSTAAESSHEWGHPYSTGMTMDGTDATTNADGNKYIYIAIRRPDGYCGKPIETGTDAFNVVFGSGSAGTPNFISNFPVDMGIYKEHTGSYNWYTHTRLTGNRNLKLDSDAAEASSSDDNAVFDTATGWGKFGYNTAKTSWLWKRYAGFDVVAYKGNGVQGREIVHSLNNTPQMIVCKKRDATGGWQTYHAAVGATKYMYWDTNAAPATHSAVWADTTPTKNVFTVGSGAETNNNNSEYLALLFASVAGVSSVGSYSGSGGSGNAQNIGFQPRFLVVKRFDTDGSWYTFDSQRTTSNPFRYQLQLDTPNTQDFINKVTISSTGWSFIGGDLNESGSTYLYYAHA